MAIQGMAKLGHRRLRYAGFTLIEVIIVVVIVGFLMMLMLPAYQESMRKGRRADAKAALMTAANREESFMLDRGTYTEDMMDLNLATVADDPMISEEGHYSIEAAECGDGIATCYTLTATPVAGGAQAEDTKCATLILRSTGAKEATGTAATECW